MNSWSRRVLARGGRLAERLRRVWSGGPEQSFGLDGLDLKVAAYLDVLGGFFVEAGANDGVSQSNTFYLERYRGWRGLLVEPIPELAARCRVNRPDCLVEECALVPFEYLRTRVRMRFCGLMSVVHGGMKTVEEELEHVRAGARIQELEPYEVEVPARTLTDVLAAYRVGKIDFLSLDVEGYELSALQGLDFDRYRPTFMLIEARYREEIDGYLSALYEPVAQLSHHDVLYRASR